MICARPKVPFVFLYVIELHLIIITLQMPFGLKSQLEMFIWITGFGFCLGPLGGISRLAFVDIIPPGHEAEFFALMEITDKGSSFIGPAIVSALWTAFPNHVRLAFLYLLLICSVAIGLLLTVDPKIALRDASSLKMAMRMRKLKKKRESQYCPLKCVSIRITPQISCLQAFIVRVWNLSFPLETWAPS